MNNRGDLNRLQCSLLIFLATPAERTGLEEAAKARSIEFETIKRSPLGEYLWFGQIGNEQIIAACPIREAGRVVMGSQGRLGTAARGIDLRNQTGAQGIIQLGMAFGVAPARQRLGDVLVSTALIPYDNRIVRSLSSNRTVVADRGGRSSIITRILALLLGRSTTETATYFVDYSEAKPESAHPELVGLFREEAEREHPYGVHLGAILSGAARIHSAAFRDKLVRGVTTAEGFVVGGEMEGVGLLAASVSAEFPIWCVVKGISDFADENRDSVITESRSVACRNAADFVLSALQYGRIR